MVNDMLPTALRTISKGNTIFCLAEHLHSFLQSVEQMPQTNFDEIVDKYVEMNMARYG